MSKKITVFSVFLFLGTFLAGSAKAICPICVVAVGAGLGLSRWLGVDDVVSSIWIGALLMSMVLWTLNEMKKRNWKFPFDSTVIFLAYYLLTFVPLYYSGIIGHPINTIFGIDKIIFGTSVGTIIFVLAHYLYLYLKNKNGGKPHFNYEKVVLPFVLLLLTSLIFYLLITWKII